MRIAGLMAAAGVVLMASCSSGPSLSDAAAELQKDTHRLETDDVFKNPLKQLNILERPDKDIPCSEGRFKRVLTATANYERNAPDADTHLDLAQRLMETTLMRQLGYKLEFDLGQTDELTGRMIRGAKEDPSIVVRVDVRPEEPTWRLHAESTCLVR
jgi:hypothetical protein